MRSNLLDPWSLPTALQVGDRLIPIRADFRQVLKVLDVFNEDLACFLRWCKALRLFYSQPIAPHERGLAAEAMVSFLSCGEKDQPGRRLICWSHDGPLIASEINKVAGCEVRQLEFVHWWTFLGWFHAIGDGPLAQIVAIRQKLSTGQRLTDSQQAFYASNRDRIRLPDPPQVQKEKQLLEQLLKGGTDGNQNLNAHGGAY